MESNIDSVLSDFGSSYLFYGNTADKKKKTFRSVAIIQQGKEDDLCYCSFDDEEAVSIIQSQILLPFKK
jgi:hypothetical protein